MEDRSEAFTEALASGDTDRVNDVIESVKDMDLDERAELFDAWFEDLAGLYADSDDGYVRQATVRAVDGLSPSMAAAVNLQEDPDAHAFDLERLRETTDATCGFLLEALVDEDGRVRQSAERALQSVVRTYDALDDRATIEALIEELEAMAEEYSGKRREHLLEAREQTAFSLRSGIGQFLRSTHGQLDLDDQ